MRKCSVNGCENPRLSSHHYCATCKAQYMRNWKAMRRANRKDGHQGMRHSDVVTETARLLDVVDAKSEEYAKRKKHYQPSFGALRVKMLVIEILRLQAQMRDMNTENLLLWKALRERA